MPYELMNRSDLAMRMNCETGECHVLIEARQMVGETEHTDYVWVAVKEGK